MGIPITDKSEYLISGSGSELYQQGVLVKGSLWSIVQVCGRLRLREYEGQIDPFILPFQVSSFFATPALNENGDIRTDRMWVWYTNSGNLTLIEVEPFTSSSPIIHTTKVMATGIISGSASIVASKPIRVLVTRSSGNMECLQYDSLSDPSPEVTQLDWDDVRGKLFSNSFGNDFLDIGYTYPGSPFNVYTESYSVPVPQNLSAVQPNPGILEVNLNWSPSTGSDEYVLERDTDSGFPSPMEVYVGSNIYFSDIVPYEGTYYYRVKARNTGTSLESSWSIPEEILVIGLTVDFSGSPLSGDADLSVQFVDLSIGATSWLWDFGDGHTSTLRSPLHTYTVANIYTVSLTANGSTTKTKIDYITVNALVDFIGTPVYGNSPLTVTFTDISIGSPTSWLWDFGDENTSTDQNPEHVYTAAGSYTVSLTVNGTFTKIKPYYVTVSLKPHAIATYDVAMPVELPDLRIAYAEGSNNYLFIDKGIRALQPASEHGSDGGGFTRPSGPSIVFD